MKNIQFRNPVFHTGLNCTVRQGYKWARLKIGEKVLLDKTKEAIIEKLMITQFKNIKDEDIECEHDPICRTKKDLFKVLCRTYPEFHVNTVVTIVYFKVIEA